MVEHSVSSHVLKLHQILGGFFFQFLEFFFRFDAVFPFYQRLDGLAFFLGVIVLAFNYPYQIDRPMEHIQTVIRVFAFA